MGLFSESVDDLNDFNLWALKTCDDLLDVGGGAREERAKKKILISF